MRNVDAPLTGILERLNKLGYKTVFSCCGFDYPDQGVRDHTCPYITFDADFKKVTRLRRAIKGWSWRLELSRVLRHWRLTRGCEHDFISVRRWCKFQKWNQLAWDVVRKALDKLEKK